MLLTTASRYRGDEGATGAYAGVSDWESVVLLTAGTVLGSGQRMNAWWCGHMYMDSGATTNINMLSNEKIMLVSCKKQRHCEPHDGSIDKPTFQLCDTSSNITPDTAMTFTYNSDAPSRGSAALPYAFHRDGVLSQN